jgi:hypothetical protein
VVRVGVVDALGVVDGGAGRAGGRGAVALGLSAYRLPRRATDSHAPCSSSSCTARTRSRCSAASCWPRPLRRSSSRAGPSWAALVLRSCPAPAHARLRRPPCSPWRSSWHADCGVSDGGDATTGDRAPRKSQRSMNQRRARTVCCTVCRDSAQVVLSTWLGS